MLLKYSPSENNYVIEVKKKCIDQLVLQEC